MKSVITRMDDELHRALKARARAEGRSVNSLINETLSRAVTTMDRRRILEARITAAGLAVSIQPRVRAPTHEEALAWTRGASTVASESVTAGRADR